MRCHYEVLGWHPDKNLDNADVAKKEFQIIQAAYELLSDPQERAWYDKHRDDILLGAKGAEYQENSVNIFEYFTSACYSGEVFNKIAAEDMEFAHDEDSDFEIPDFGDSKSSYDERLMERDNKKLRDAGRKQRNEEIRTLVSFVRKRDPRVKAYIKLLEEKAAQNVLKTKMQQERHREERRQLLEQASASRFAQMSDLEQQLKVNCIDIEAQYTSSNNTSESGGSDCDYDVGESLEEKSPEKNDSEEDYEIDELMELYCPACKKAFKTIKARESHDRSKKHQDKVRSLRQMLLKEDELDVNEELDQGEQEDDDESEDEKVIVAPSTQNIEKLTADDVKESEESDKEADAVGVEQVAKKKKIKKKNKKALSAIPQFEEAETPDGISTKPKKISESKTDRKWNHSTKTNDPQNIFLDWVSTKQIKESSESKFNRNKWNHSTKTNDPNNIYLDWVSTKPIKESSESKSDRKWNHSTKTADPNNIYLDWVSTKPMKESSESKSDRKWNHSTKTNDPQNIFLDWVSTKPMKESLESKFNRNKWNHSTKTNDPNNTYLDWVSTKPIKESSESKSDRNKWNHSTKTADPNNIYLDWVSTKPMKESSESKSDRNRWNHSTKTADPNNIYLDWVSTKPIKESSESKSDRNKWNHSTKTADPNNIYLDWVSTKPMKESSESKSDRKWNHSTKTNDPQNIFLDWVSTKSMTKSSRGKN
nr:EOG090X085R [Eurycercus lamellatus]